MSRAPRFTTAKLDEAFFQREYYEARKSTEQIGREIGCTGRAIRDRMAALGLVRDTSFIKTGKPWKSDKPWRGGKPPHFRGEQHAKWKGGRYKNKGGYVLVQAIGHPQANAQGYIMEHRLVMEQMLGRPLVRSDRVHHINHEPSDNRPENLQLMSHGEHI